MKTLVTGGAGFIGSALVDHLLNDGADVTVVDDLSRGRRDQVDGRARFCEMNVGSPALAALIAEVSPDVVFHHAAQIDVRRSVREPLLDTQTNVFGTVNILDACTRARVPRFVFASSGGALYGDTESIPTGEDHPAAPESVYGAAKLCGEIYGDVFSRLHGIEFISLRYGNVYGPRQDPHGEAGVIAIFAERLLGGEPGTIFGTGEQTRDYVYVDDVVEANLLAARADHLGAYNVGTGKETDVNNLYARVAELCGVERAASYGPAKLGEQQRSCLDVRRAANRLGWRPQVSLDEGLARTVRWFAQRGADAGLDGEQMGRKLS